MCRLSGLIKHPTEKDYWNSSQAGWMGLVEDFSKRALTQETDKLIAVSGLAKMISHSPQGTDVAASQKTLHDVPDQSSNSAAADSYVAGLWRDNFVLELAWRVVEREKNKPSSYLAPTWSWGSVNGSVLYDFREAIEEWENKPTLKMDCTLDDVVCEAKLPSDPTGALKGAHAILTGPLVPVELMTLDESLSEDWKAKYENFALDDPERKRKTLVRAANLASVEVYLDREQAQERCLKKGDAEADCWIDGWCERQCCAWDNGRSDKEEKTMLYCLRLFSWQAHYEEEPDRVVPSELWFLVLRKSRLVEEAYERVGVGVRNPGYENRARYGWLEKGEDPDYCPIFEGCKVSTIKVV
jgi:hypothetical protein